MKKLYESHEKKNRRRTMRKATRRSRKAARDGELQNTLAFKKAIGEYRSNVCMSCK